MTGIVSYGDYQGSVTFEDGVLVLRILHIDDLIVTEVTDSSQVQQRFADLVEEYLETCREVGKDPCKAYRGSFNVRIAPDLHRRAARAATVAGQSLNAWIQSAVEEKLTGRGGASVWEPHRRLLDRIRAVSPPRLYESTEDARRFEGPVSTLIESIAAGRGTWETKGRC